MTYRCADSICYLVNSNAFKHNPLIGIFIPESYYQVSFVNSFRYISLVIGEGDGYWWVKGSTVRSKVIGETKNIGVCRWGWRLCHLNYTYFTEGQILFGLGSGTFINGESNLAIFRFSS